jgi:hypothetical protein
MEQYPSTSSRGVRPLLLTGNTTEQQKVRLEEVLIEAARAAYQASVDRLDADSARIVLQRVEKLQTDLVHTTVETVRRFTESDSFRGEEIQSNRCYPPTYRPRSVEVQFGTLRRLFPALQGCREKIGRKPLLEGAEDWFVIPALAGSWLHIQSSRRAHSQTAGRAAQGLQPHCWQAFRSISAPV